MIKATQRRDPFILKIVMDSPLYMTYDASDFEAFFDKLVPS